jgi:hypothetical protein
LPQDVDLVFICSFTHAALLAYALSNFFRSKGAVTVLGGPHARCYPDDAVKYFDYVLGFTHKSTIMEVLDNCEPQGAVAGNFQRDSNRRAFRVWKNAGNLLSRL